MKSNKQIVMMALCMVIGVSMMAGAVSIVVLSNVVSNNNQVGLPVSIQITSTATTPGGDLPDYAPGAIAQNTAYDMKVSWTTTTALSTSDIVVEFTKTDGINATDVLMNWTDISVWHSIVWTVNGNTLHGILGATGSQPSGSTVNYYATLIYTVTGNFNFKMWVEGAIQ